MIYDCFYFFDEIHLLEIRLNILNSVVDKFILVESPETFNGVSKSLIYLENKNKFKKWSDKIIYHCVDNFPSDNLLLNKALLSPNTGNKEHWWVREFYQKESLIKPLDDNCLDDDIVFISDVDEIWNPKIKIIIDDNIYRPKQTAYPFYLNNKSDQNINAWTGTRYAKYKIVKKYGPNHLRSEWINKSILQENGGWHFSWLGAKSSNKWNDNHPDNLNRFNSISNSKMIKDESGLPDYLLQNREYFVNQNLMLK